ncbi:MAG: hypothetical protein AMXMBFR46_11730 [Acidimicrobiia bacterium]
MPPTERFVLDASAAVTVLSTATGFAGLPGTSFAAPPLLWSEVTSVLHRAVVRHQVSAELGREVLRRLEDAPIRPEQPPGLFAAAWDVADALDWSKTYDAEYLALARVLECPLVTLDERQRRAAARLVPAGALTLAQLVER